MRGTAFVGLVALLGISLNAPSASATFPGANGELAYYNYVGNPPQIFVIQPDGTGKAQLTSTTRLFSFDPAFSADGTKIAYSTLSPRRGTFSLRMMAADGTGQAVITSLDSPYVEIDHAAWSPDGSQLVFCAFTSHYVGKIFTVNADGTGLTKLSRKGQDDCYPDWSPDGTTILFETFINGIPSIRTMSPAGSNRVQIGDGAEPSWSPDGTEIAFVKKARRRFDVFRMNADGTGVTRVTFSARRWEWRPVFSPDGTEIAFSRSVGRASDDTDDIWTITVPAGVTTQVTDTPQVDEFGLSWQPIVG